MRVHIAEEHRFSALYCALIFFKAFFIGLFQYSAQDYNFLR